jgi:hypothetical protein
LQSDCRGRTAKSVDRDAVHEAALDASERGVADTSRRPSGPQAEACRPSSGADLVSRKSHQAPGLGVGTVDRAFARRHAITLGRMAYPRLIACGQIRMGDRAPVPSWITWRSN